MAEDKPKKPRKKGSGGARPGAGRKTKSEFIENNPDVLKAKSIVPVLDGQKLIQEMTFDEVAEYINNLGEGQTVRKITAFALAVQNISRGVNIKDVNDMRNRFYLYCALSERVGMRIGNMNAYHAMGISYVQAIDWRKGGAGSTAERRELIAEVDAICSGTREMLAGMQQINPVLAIFWQKNYDGLKDVQDHVVSTGDPLGDKQSREQIQEKYQDIIEE